MSQWQFFDIGKWQCWSCPRGFKRTIFSVDSAKACAKANKKIRGEFGKAAFGGPVCPKGSFYDPARDGECWSCPKGYKRSAASIRSKNACFVPAKEAFKKINTHKKATGIFKTDCPKGQFWDAKWGKCHSCASGYKRTGYAVNHARACSKLIKEKIKTATLVKQAICSAGEFKDRLYQKNDKGRKVGAGGTCWSCKKGWDRTVFAVHGNKACEKGGGFEYKDASKKADLTCPSGEVFDFIGLTKKDIRTRPELKGKSGIKPVKSGTCWTCPSGYDRTLSGVKGKNACEAKTMAWYSIPYSEPGFFKLKGSEQVLLDITKERPDLIQKAIKKAGEAASKNKRGKVDKAKYAKMLKREQANFANAPQDAVSASGVVFLRLLSVIGSPKKATKAEKELVEAFKDYIVAKRSHVAQDALDAYDAWVKADAYWKTKDSRGKGMTALLDYGTVPPDFSTIAMANSMGMGAIDYVLGEAADKLVGDAIPIIGDILSLGLNVLTNTEIFSDPELLAKWGAQTAAETAIGVAADLAIKQLGKAALNTAQKQITKQLAGMATKHMIKEAAKHAASGPLKAAGSAGPQIIITAAVMIAQMAIEQVIEIQNARPKLLASLATAKHRPDLSRIAKTEDGVMELLGYWGQLVSTTAKPTAGFTKKFAPVAKAALVAKVDTSKSASKSKKRKATPWKISGKWSQLKGAATDAGMGANGKLWIIGANKQPGGYGIYRWDRKWRKIKGSATRISVDPKGNAWIVNKLGSVFSHDGRVWRPIKGPKAYDIGVGANGAVWIIGGKKEAGGFGIYRLDRKGWKKIRGSASRVAVGPKGKAWIVNNKGAVFRYNGKRWLDVKGLKAKDIGVGAGGHVWAIGGQKITGGYQVWTLIKNRWKKYSGGLANIAVGPKGRPVGINTGNKIFVMK